MNINNSQKAFIVISMFALGGAGIYLYEGSTGYSDDGAGNCYCTSCDDCELALSDAVCTIVYLNNSIISTSVPAGSCIDNPDFNNKIFDCQNNIIQCNAYDYVAIKITDKVNFTIKNCFISGCKFFAIRLYNDSNFSVENNNILNSYYSISILESDNGSVTEDVIESNVSNSVGIYSSNSNNITIEYNIVSKSKYCMVITGYGNNTITGNNALLCSYGIYLYQTSDNIINTNFACSNSIVDIIQDSSINTGDNNTCLISTYWNDTGTTSCTYMCIGASQKIKCWTNATITETTNNFATATTTIEGETFTSTSNVTVRFIDIEIDKNKTGNVQYKRKGHYMVYITNTGNETLNITKLYDSIYGNINLSSCSPGMGLIKAGEVITCQFDSNILYTTESNNISVTGSLEGFSVSDWDNETIYVYGSAVCNITALKTANSTRFRCNDSVSYNLSLNNTGVCDFTNLRISDSFSLIQSPYLNCNLSNIPAMVNLSAGEYWSYKYYCTVNCIR